MKLKCKCGNLATWYYMPAEREWTCCEKCVPRGCTCNNEPVSFEDEDGVYDNSPEGVEGLDWEWIEEGEYWRNLDGEGKLLPCCEWFYEEEGWEKEND